MWDKLKNYLRARKTRNSTEREICLEAELKAAKQDAVTWKGHFKTQEKDFASLFGDHLELQARFKELQFARLEDWRLGRHVAEETRAARQEPTADFWGRAARAVAQ